LQIDKPQQTPYSAVFGGSPFEPTQACPILSFRPFNKGIPMFDRIQNNLAHTDPELLAVIELENQRQQDHIELIASENYTSPAVMEAQGSQLTNKYAEGYPGKRYYGGCEHVDVVEQMAIDRVKELFDAECANVQPNSGSQANQGVFFAVLQPGDTIMGMSLAEGGHLTHGMKLNQSGKWFNVVSYGLDANEDIDYDAMEALARQAKPKLIIAGASAFALKIDFERFAKIAKEVGAYFMVDMAHYAGLIAAGVYPNPVPHADFVTTTTRASLKKTSGSASQAVWISSMRRRAMRRCVSCLKKRVCGRTSMSCVTGSINRSMRFFRNGVIATPRVWCKTPSIGSLCASPTRLCRSHSRRWNTRRISGCLLSRRRICAFHGTMPMQSAVCLRAAMTR
jgi:hypothetical protein